MAAAAITLGPKPATIESDSTGAVITNYQGTPGQTGTGTLRNHGSADVWLFVSLDQNDAAVVGDVATTGAQAQGQIPLPAGASLPILRHYLTIAHKTASGTAVLSWIPTRE